MSAAAPTQNKALRKLFLTIFLRGRSARGLQKQGAPKSIGARLGYALFFYALIGAGSAILLSQSIFGGSVVLHTSTLMFIGMFVAASAGEALFNKEEADILLHRPVPPRALLWAKVRVMVEVSLWLASAFNFAGFIVGSYFSKPPGLYFVAHAISVTMLALFCTGLVVVTYQLCLRWFGRERLDGLITTAQTLMAVLVVVGSQLAPQILMRNSTRIATQLNSWWLALLPSAWFAGFDDAIAGSRAMSSFVLAGIAVIATVAVLWAGFGALARDYGSGLQTLNEASPKKGGKRSAFFRRLASVFPFNIWLRNPIERASFLLCTSYLLRDRDVKLRVFPGLAPMLMMPIIMLLPQRNAGPNAGFMVALAGSYLGMVPSMGLTFLRFSAQWQAADIFRTAPMSGPGPLIHGARKAVFLMLTLPTMLFFVGVVWAMGAKQDQLVMLIPGLITLPLFGLIPVVTSEAVPLSESPEDARSAKRGLQTFGIIIGSMALAGAAAVARSFSLLLHFIVAEAIIAFIIYQILLYRCRTLQWSSME